MPLPAVVAGPSFSSPCFPRIDLERIGLEGTSGFTRAIDCHQARGTSSRDTSTEVAARVADQGRTRSIVTATSFAPTRDRLGESFEIAAGRHRPCRTWTRARRRSTDGTDDSFMSFDIAIVSSSVNFAGSSETFTCVSASGMREPSAATREDEHGVGRRHLGLDRIGQVHGAAHGRAGRRRSALASASRAAAGSRDIAMACRRAAFWGAAATAAAGGMPPSLRASLMLAAIDCAIGESAGCDDRRRLPVIDRTLVVLAIERGGAGHRQRLPVRRIDLQRRLHQFASACRSRSRPWLIASASA